MKTATLLLLISALLGATTRAATVSFSGIPSTNVVNASDLLLLDSHLGGTNYSTRTLTVSNLSSVIISSNNWQNVGTTNSSLAGVASAGGFSLSGNSLTTWPWINVGSGIIAPLGMTNTDFSDTVIAIFPDGTTTAYTPHWDQTGLNADAYSFAANATNTDYHVNPAALISQFTAFDTNFDAIVGQPNGWAAGIWGFINITRYGTQSPLDLSSVFPPKTDMGMLASSASGGDNASGLWAGANGLATNGFGVVGYSGAHQGYAVGVSGLAPSGGTNSIGGLFAVFTNTKTVVPNTSAALVADSMDSGLPILIGRTNNGNQVFQVANSGAVSSVSSYTSGAPSGGTAAAWKLGSYRTNYVEAEVGGSAINLSLMVTPLAVSYATSVNVNFAANKLLTTILAGNETLTASNQSDGRSIDYEFYNGQSTNVNVVLPSTWRIQSGAVTNILAPNASATLSMRYYAFITNTVALWASE